MFDAASIDPRLLRVRRLAWLLDRSIPLGGRFRIGLDPLIGLVPGVGDAMGVLLSLYIVFEGARLGLPGPVLGRMIANTLIEGVVGTVPVVGDLFDAAWQANARNVRLIERHYRPERADRPVGRIATGLVILALVAVLLVILIAALLIAAIWRLAS